VVEAHCDLLSMNGVLEKEWKKNVVDSELMLGVETAVEVGDEVRERLETDLSLLKYPVPAKRSRYANGSCDRSIRRSRLNYGGAKRR
jgi:hypothetical protein